MRRPTRLKYLVAAVSAVLLVLPAPTAAAEPAKPAKPPARPEAFGPPVDITLVTGDRLAVQQSPDGRTSVTVDPASARDGVTYATSAIGKDVSVIPSDAMPLLTAGRLDPRLFNVTELLKNRYDDAHTGTLSLIAQRSKRAKATAVTGGHIRRRLPKSGFDVLNLTKKDARTAWRSLKAGAGVRKLWLDGTTRLLDDTSNTQIGAPAAWAAGYTGTGVTVAVLDSGYDSGHPDLSGVVTQSANFTTESGIQDGAGHGTHVASTIAGSGSASGGKYKGVAPGAELAIGKVCLSNRSCPNSAILAGMEWAAGNVKAKIINLSLGGLDEPGVDPLEEAVNELSSSTSSLFVIAAGNSGPGASTLYSPGTADAALTVGAVDGNDQIASFSSRGPRRLDQAAKPDITAPGVSIVAARATGTSMGSPVDTYYTAASGTSMATPHVAGAAAILAQRHPSWTGQALKGALMSTAKQVSGQTFDQQGSGRLDVAAAVRSTLAPLMAGDGYYHEWPHTTGQAHGWLLGYQNAGTAAVDLTLTLNATDSSGNAAPAGVFKLSRTQFNVPAGTAVQQGAVLTSHGDAAPPGRYFADVIAKTADGTVVAHTMTSTYIEPEMYDVTINMIDRYGQVPGNPYGVLVDKTQLKGYALKISGGAGTVRVPPGDYTANLQFADGSNSYRFTVAALPVRVAGADVSLTADARQGVPLGHSVDASDAVAAAARVTIMTSSGGSNAFYFPGNAIAPYVLVIPAAQTGVDYFASTQWLKNGVEPSPYSYQVADYRTGGGIPANPGATGVKDQMVRITNDFRLEGTAAQLLPSRIPWVPGQGIQLNIPRSLTAPLVREEYYTAHTRIWWAGSCYLGTSADPFASVNEDGMQYFHTAGYRGTESWNNAGIGPAVPSAYNDDYGDHRIGDTLYIDPRFMHTDWGVQFNGGSGFPHNGLDRHASGTVTLAQNGQTIYTGSTSNTFTLTVPAADQTYTLTQSATRDVTYSALSTQVKSVWTFRSSHDSAGYTALPLMQPRLFLQSYLDGYNRAKTGTTTPISFFFTGNATVSASPKPLSTAQIEASFDDGATWQSLPTTIGTYGLPLASASNGVTNPSAPGYVSLRVSATDTAGTTATTTIIRAYQVVA